MTSRSTKAENNLVPRVPSLTPWSTREDPGNDVEAESTVAAKAGVFFYFCSTFSLLGLKRLET